MCKENIVCKKYIFFNLCLLLAKQHFLLDKMCDSIHYYTNMEGKEGINDDTHKKRRQVFHGFKYY